MKRNISLLVIFGLILIQSIVTLPPAHTTSPVPAISHWSWDNEQDHHESNLDANGNPIPISTTPLGRTSAVRSRVTILDENSLYDADDEDDDNDGSDNETIITPTLPITAQRRVIVEEDVDANGDLVELNRPHHSTSSTEVEEEHELDLFEILMRRIEGGGRQRTTWTEFYCSSPVNLYDLTPNSQLRNNSFSHCILSMG